MKKIIEDNSDEGLVSLLGETVTLFCMNYFYNGKLIGVNSSCVKLKNPKIIYETGKWEENDWQDAQSMDLECLYVQVDAIESFAKTK